MDVCGCDQDTAPDEEDTEEEDEEDDMFSLRTPEQQEAFKRLALELETDAKLVTLAGWRPYTRPRDLRKTFVSLSSQWLLYGIGCVEHSQTKSIICRDRC